jgi:hypothetical protein
MTRGTLRSLTTHCADVVSIAGGRFRWANRSRGSEGSGTSIEDLGSHLCRDLGGGPPIALGFECPLFVPLAVLPLAWLRARW